MNSGGVSRGRVYSCSCWRWWQVRFDRFLFVCCIFRFWCYCFHTWRDSVSTMRDSFYIFTAVLRLVASFPMMWMIFLTELLSACWPGTLLLKKHRVLTLYISVFEITGKSHYLGQKKDTTLHHIVTEWDIILAIFLDFWKRLKILKFKMQPSKNVLHFRWAF